MLLPTLYILFFGKKIHSFHFFGILGFICGTLLGIIISIHLQLNPYLILLMSGVGAVSFFGLALLAKRITGDEVIVYYHHEICIILLCTLTLQIMGSPILPYLDITLSGIGVFLAFGRIGCYSVGCCHGRPFKYGVKYGQHHVDAGFTWHYKDICLLPVQLVESFYVLIIVIINVILLFNHALPGTVLVCYTVIYGLFRFVLEFLRGDAERAIMLGLSEAQWTTLILISLTFGMSKLGWLPQYSWHLVILLFLLAIAASVILFFRYRPGYLLFTAPHISQIADGLEKLSRDSSGHLSSLPIVYTTQAGLHLSCARIRSDKDVIEHFTFSYKNQRVLTTAQMYKIARLLNRLKSFEGQYEVIEKDHGVFHVLFSNAGTIEKTKNIET